MHRHEWPPGAVLRQCSRHGVAVRVARNGPHPAVGLHTPGRTGRADGPDYGARLRVRLRLTGGARLVSHRSDQSGPAVRCADLHDAVRRDQGRADRRLYLRQADYARHGDRRAGPLAAHAMLVRRVAPALRQAARAGRGHDDDGALLGLRDPRVPDLPLPDVPDGDASHNKIVRTWGEPAPKGGKPHWEIGEQLGLLDLARGAKISGSGFPVFVGPGSKLVRALINFMLDLHTREHGYVEVEPPFVVKRATMQGTGQDPKFADDAYKTAPDDLFLVPTAEVPVTNLHRDEILDGGKLPLCYTAYTPCFRREAGAAGRDTRGLLRVHQFDKVELVRFARPAESPAEHERMTGHAEVVLQRLELPYRVVLLAVGDLGFASAKTYDLEVWAPGVGQWLEVSSSSSFTDFQARRANIRYRASSGAKPELAHTLNASGVALPRTIAALLETRQQPDGSVTVPAALVPYLGMERLVPSSADGA